MRLVIAAAALAVFAGPALASSHGGGQGGKMGGHFIENWDIDGDGTVTLEEVMERRSDVFASFDADEDGKLSGEEYDVFDEARANDIKEMGGGMGQGNGNGAGNPANGMKREFTDMDKDGFVTREEFMASTPGWFTRMDKNGDGVVTKDDFGPRG